MKSVESHQSVLLLTLIPVVFRIRNGMLFTKNSALVYAKNYANPQSGD